MKAPVCLLMVSASVAALGASVIGATGTAHMAKPSWRMG